MIKISFLCSLLLLFLYNINQISYAQDINNVKLISIYDGDTIFVDLDCQYEVLCKRIGVRLIGIDTPEMKSKDLCEVKKAQEAKQFLVNVFNNAHTIDLRDVSRDKYFRIDATLYINKINVNDLLIYNRLAVKYDGGTKRKINWCNLK